MLKKEPWGEAHSARRIRPFGTNRGPGGKVRDVFPVNERDEEKVRKALTHLLIDDPDINLCSLPSKLASIAAAKECAATRWWLFDFDLDDEDAAREFAGDIAQMTNGAVDAFIRKTPHGYAILTSRGFDTRQLMEKWGDCVTLMKDDMLCAAWGVNREPEKDMGKDSDFEEPFLFI